MRAKGYISEQDMDDLGVPKAKWQGTHAIRSSFTQGSSCS